MLSNPWNKVYGEWSLVCQPEFWKKIQFPPFSVGVNLHFQSFAGVLGEWRGYVCRVWPSLFTGSLCSRRIQQQFPCSQFPCSQFPVLPAQPALCLESPGSPLPLKATVAADVHLLCLFLLSLLPIILKIKHWQPFTQRSPSILVWFCSLGQNYSSSVSPVSSYCSITRFGALFTLSFHLLNDAKSIHQF